MALLHFVLILRSKLLIAMYSSVMAGIHRSIKLEDMMKFKSYKLAQAHKKLKDHSEKVVQLGPLSLPVNTHHQPQARYQEYYICTYTHLSEAWLPYRDWNSDYGLWKLEHTTTLPLAGNWNAEGCEFKLTFFPTRVCEVSPLTVGSRDGRSKCSRNDTCCVHHQRYV